MTRFTINAASPVAISFELVDLSLPAHTQLQFGAKILPKYLGVPYKDLWKGVRDADRSPINITLHTCRKGPLHIRERSPYT